MLTVWNCIAYEHDPRLLALAVAICALSSFTAISLLHHVRRCSGRARLIWLIVSATTTGFGIWATHFIAMLAFEPGIPNAYNVALTFLSLISAIVLTAVGFAVALAPNVRAGAWLGGAIVGGGIAAMHYTGMAAFEIQGRIFWDPTLVAASILLGAIFGSAALPIGLHQGRMYWRLLGALLMTLAICSHHFTAMGAAALLPDPTITVPDTALPSGLLAIAVALATLIIVVLALAGAARCATAAAANSRPNACAVSPTRPWKDCWSVMLTGSSP
jgi:diguanylate cyclase